MPRHLPSLLIVLPLALAACDHQPREPDDRSDAPSAAARPGPPPVGGQAATDAGGDVMPRDPEGARSAAEDAGVSSMLSFQGLGPARFGDDVEALREAYGRPLVGGEPAPGSSCHYLFPEAGPSAPVGFMIEDGAFVRVDVDGADVAAPGGGAVGMLTSQIEELYPGRITVSQGKYDADTDVLTVESNDGSGNRLVFTTDAGARVVSWRLGQPPQVDYVEGCG
ncbi:hypothetical protein [Coralloluteibacterium stylophorae]|uniref:Lectin n=1 Tax=Coralloluteibacterium stylophorae TaxID=1776034 RepID=A0A8J8AZ25_9GAMM|nr:hypothetical protein [Coralloluteibacterium stylophorae]MBS7457887.1 hypothetical protein [Coralloluteibacterium stylophorae]